MGKGSSASKKDKAKEYKAKGLREKHKAQRFERWVKRFVKQAEKGRIRVKKQERDFNTKKRIKTLTDKWTFGPIGHWVDEKFIEKIPAWMSKVIDKYEEYYNKKPKAKSAPIYDYQDRVVNGRVLKVKVKRIK